MNGTSSYPLSHLSLQRLLVGTLPERLPTFDPSRHLIHDSETVTVLPFDTSPLNLPTLLKQALPLSILPDEDDPVRTAYTVTDVEWKKLDVTPLYVPFYVAKMEFEGKEETWLMESERAEGDPHTIYAPRALDQKLQEFDKPYLQRKYNRPITQLLKQRSQPSLKVLQRSGLPNVNSLSDQPDLFQLDFDPYPDEWSEESEESKEWNRVMEFRGRLKCGVEDWMDKKETREVLRRASLETREVGEGERVVGRMVHWEEMKEDE